MAWSTRQVAELAGTTVKTVRHYHKVGLLDEPERGANGYKHYGVNHLTRLLRIRRLTDLGVSLPQIAAMGEADEHPQEAFRVLDAELAATVDRLQRVRAELALIMGRSLPTDLPSELAPVIDNLSEADRALMVVYGRVLSPDGIQAMRRMLAGLRGDPVDVEMDELPADADEETRRDLATRFHHRVRAIHDASPDVVDIYLKAQGGAGHAADTIHLATADLYNLAQIDVLERVGRLLRQGAGRDGT